MTISQDYLAQQKELHKNPNYGVASLHHAPLVAEIIDKFGIRSVSDYGAGKCNLLKKLTEMGKGNIAYFPYDPAFPEYGPPKKAELVCCIDVLEHVEQKFLPSVLKQLAGIMERAGFFTIHTGPAIKTLPDGRNAHLIQKPSSWWLPKLCQHFEILQLQSSAEGFFVIVKPKEK